MRCGCATGFKLLEHRGSSTEAVSTTIRRLLALVVLLLALVVTPATAVATTLPGTRVSASTFAAPLHTGPPSSLAADRQPENTSTYDGQAVEVPVATEGASSELAFPGGLGANDALGGGHVLAHVGLDDSALAARGLPEASTFIDRATAESALSDVQAANSSDIQSWLAGANAGSRQAFGATFSNPIGSILYAGAGSSVDGSTAIAILRADASSPLGYYLITGYVAP